jgi:hypothetical protein
MGRSTRGPSLESMNSRSDSRTLETLRQANLALSLYIYDPKIVITGTIVWSNRKQWGIGLPKDGSHTQLS